MKIAVIGLGFVGLSLTSVLASKGNNVIGIDVDVEKCKKIRSGIAPFFEPDLEKMLRIGLKKKLIISDDFSLVKDCDIIFVDVFTDIDELVSKVFEYGDKNNDQQISCLLYTSPSPRD